jgi:hypothetical protein
MFLWIKKCFSCQIGHVFFRRLYCIAVRCATIEPPPLLSLQYIFNRSQRSAPVMWGACLGLDYSCSIRFIPQQQISILPSRIPSINGLVESLQLSQNSYTVPLVHWSTRLLPVMRDPGSAPGGYLCETEILLLALSLYIGDPDVIDHCGLVKGGLRSRTITRLSCWQCDNPTWSHTALLSRLHARCRPSFRLHNWHSQLLGGIPVESLQSHSIHT